MALLSIASTLLNGESTGVGGASLVWLSNGFLTGVLLCAPKRQWPSFLLLGYIIDFALNLSQSNAPITAAFFSFCNMTEVTLSAGLMFVAVAPDPDLTQAKQLRSLLVNGVLLAPAVASTMSATYLRMAFNKPLGQSFRSWFAADVLGAAMMIPLYLSQHYGRRFSSRSKPETTSLFLLLGIVSTAVFLYTSYPTLWIVLLTLLLLGVRVGFTGSAAGLLLVTFIGGNFTVKGYGPLRPDGHGSLLSRMLFFQSFIALSMLSLYVIEVAKAASGRVRANLESSENRFRSLAEASRDIIVLAELNGNRKYVSPAITEMLGWEQDDLIGQYYGHLAHPDDAPKIGEVLQEMRDGNKTNPLAYRCRKRDGTYLWLESTGRLLRNEENGEAHGFVHVLRDISDRKAAEEQMQQAYETVEKLALLDGLTGVANRRLLDQTLAREWISSKRDGSMLSVVLIDVDLFKSYNDFYGHLEGDECLRQVATRLQSVLRRPLDLLARYGGEEFVAVLPNTPEEGAEAIGEQMRRAVEQCLFPHSQSPYGIVTVSLGCATQVPSESSSVSQLLKLADTALYQAKTGRTKPDPRRQHCRYAAAVSSTIFSQLSLPNSDRSYAESTCWLAASLHGSMLGR